jgi:hypothetical protein
VNRRPDMAKSEPVEAGGKLGAPGRLLAWLRSIPPSLFVFQILGWIALLAYALPNDLPTIRTFGVMDWLYYVALFSAPIPIIIALALRAGATSPTVMVTRKIRFAVSLFLGVICAQTANIVIRPGYFLHQGIAEFPFSRMASESICTMIIAGIFGWLSLLYLQRSEDQAKLGLLMMKRSTLARQVAQSRLLAARAQIDPEVVARVLRGVRVRYQKNSGDASTLLDQLVSYLRLAMNRVGEQHPSLFSEVALIRSYLALREAESGVTISLRTTLEGHESDRQDFPSLPLFLIVRRLHDETTLACTAEAAMRIEARRGQIVLILEAKSPKIDPDEVARIRDRLNYISFDGLCTLDHTFDSGVNRYVVQVTAN